MALTPLRRGSIAALPAALLLFGCGAPDTAAPTALVRSTANIGGYPVGNGTVDRNEVEVCKVGSTATITLVSQPQNQPAPPVTEVADFLDGECFVMNFSVATPPPYDNVTVTEGNLPANTVLDSIVVFQGVAPRRDVPLNITRTVLTGTNTASVQNGLELGSMVVFYNRFVPPPPPGGGQGCTPGYWKQSQHYDSYPAPYTFDTQFSSVFEDAFPGKTFVEVMSTGGGGLDALGRHTVAALLNAASSGVSYDLTVADVIAGFNNAYPGSKNQYNAQKDIFEAFNEQGCPLN